MKVLLLLTRWAGSLWVVAWCADFFGAAFFLVGLGDDGRQVLAPWLVALLSIAAVAAFLGWTYGVIYRPIRPVPARGAAGAIVLAVALAAACVWLVTGATRAFHAGYTLCANMAPFGTGSCNSLGDVQTQLLSMQVGREIGESATALSMIFLTLIVVTIVRIARAKSLAA